MEDEVSERYNLTVPRKYTANGEEKTAWDPCGVMFRRDNGGFSITLTMFPELRIMAFPPKDDGEDRPRKQAPKSAPVPDDEIPF